MKASKARSEVPCAHVKLLAVTDPPRQRPKYQVSPRYRRRARALSFVVQGAGTTHVGVPGSRHTDLTNFMPPTIGTISPRNGFYRALHELLFSLNVACCRHSRARSRHDSVGRFQRQRCVFRGRQFNPVAFRLGRDRYGGHAGICLRVASDNPVCRIRDEHWWWLVTLYQADQINQ
jgi:hypothetical protein